MSAISRLKHAAAVATDEAFEVESGELEWAHVIRSILEAMRDPNSEAIRAGAEAMGGGVSSGSCQDALLAWQAMIDYLLREANG